MKELLIWKPFIPTLLKKYIFNFYEDFNCIFEKSFKFFLLIFPPHGTSLHYWRVTFYVHLHLIFSSSWFSFIFSESILPCGPGTCWFLSKHLDAVSAGVVRCFLARQVRRPPVLPAVVTHQFPMLVSRCFPGSIRIPCGIVAYNMPSFLLIPLSMPLNFRYTRFFLFDVFIKINF